MSRSAWSRGLALVAPQGGVGGGQLGRDRHPGHVLGVLAGLVALEQGDHVVRPDGLLAHRRDVEHRCPHRGVGAGHRAVVELEPHLGRRRHHRLRRDGGRIAGVIAGRRGGQVRGVGRGYGPLRVVSRDRAGRHDAEVVRVEDPVQAVGLPDHPGGDRRLDDAGIAPSARPGGRPGRPGRLAPRPALRLAAKRSAAPSTAAALRRRRRGVAAEGARGWQEVGREGGPADGRRGPGGAERDRERHHVEVDGGLRRRRRAPRCAGRRRSGR